MSAERLDVFCNYRLDMNRLNSGTLQVNVRPVNLYTLLSSIRDMAQLEASPQNVKVILNSQKKGNFLIDGQLLKQILMKLLQNAVRYSKFEGTVYMDVQVVQNLLDNSRTKLEISVVDQGAGIHDNKLKKLFTPMVRPGQGEKVTVDSGLQFCHRVA